MNGETSYYYPSTCYCRKRFSEGDFGHFVYGEGNYLHDMSHGFYDAFKFSGGEHWQQVAGFPPMYYPTHSTSLVLSVTGARATHVSCQGYIDREEDGVFGVGANLWDNPYSNQVALMKTSDGGMLRVNEFRRVGWSTKISGNPMSIYGTKASFEQNALASSWTDLTSGGAIDLFDELDCFRMDGKGESPLRKGEENMHESLLRDFNTRKFAKSHPKERLPKEFDGARNGHLGSHQFLVDDFAKSVAQKALPRVNAWEAAKYCAPGLTAHESCLQGGALLEIPDLGTPPGDWAPVDVDTL
jgi:predicted dehydrogenase